jgi:hypothetical protein
MEKRAPMMRLIPHNSNFLASGRRINETIKAKLMGISTDLAKIKAAKSAITVAIEKNNR